MHGIGKVNAIKAKDLRIGDMTIWSHGSLAKVTSVIPSATGKTLKIGMEFKNYNGELVQNVRELGAERLVGIDNRG